jgi:hypothetical protein
LERDKLRNELAKQDRDLAQALILGHEIYMLPGQNGQEKSRLAIGTSPVTINVIEVKVFTAPQ